MSPFVWQSDPELLRFGPMAIRWYGLFFAGAFFSGFYWMQHVFVSEGRDPEALDSLLYKAVFGVLIGARLAHCLFYEPGFYLSHPMEILKVWRGGLASHGGVTGLLFVLWLHARTHPETSLAWLSDRLVVAATFGGALIRMGNFFNSELIGTPTQLPWGVIFALRDTIPRHPVQLYESLSYLVIAGILFRAYQKKAGQIPWMLTCLSLTLIFSARFVLESFKTHQVAFDPGLPIRMGQFLSLPFILAGIVGLILAIRARRR